MKNWCLLLLLCKNMHFNWSQWSIYLVDISWTPACCMVEADSANGQRIHYCTILIILVSLQVLQPAAIYLSISCFLPQNNVHNYSPFPLPNFSTLLPSFNLWEHWWSHPRSKMVIKLTTWASQVGMDASFLFLKIDVWQVTKLYSHLDG